MTPTNNPLWLSLRESPKSVHSQHPVSVIPYLSQRFKQSRVPAPQLRSTSICFYAPEKIEILPVVIGSFEIQQGKIVIIIIIIKHNYS